MKNLIKRIVGFFKAVTPHRVPALIFKSDTYATRVDDHAAALVALMEATVAVRQWTGIKPAVAVADYADSLDFLKLLLNAETNK